MLSSVDDAVRLARRYAYTFAPDVRPADVLSAFRRLSPASCREALTELRLDPDTSTADLATFLETERARNSRRRKLGLADNHRGA